MQINFGSLLWLELGILTMLQEDYYMSTFTKEATLYLHLLCLSVYWLSYIWRQIYHAMNHIVNNVIIFRISVCSSKYDIGIQLLCI